MESPSDLLPTAFESSILEPLVPEATETGVEPSLVTGYASFLDLLIRNHVPVLPEGTVALEDVRRLGLVSPSLYLQVFSKRIWIRQSSSQTMRWVKIERNTRKVRTWLQSISISRGSIVKAPETLKRFWRLLQRRR